MRKKEACSLPRFAVFYDCLAVAISAAEGRSVEFVSVLQKFIHKCFKRFRLFHCGEFVIRDLFHIGAQGISVDFFRQARRLLIAIAGRFFTLLFYRSLGAWAYVIFPFLEVVRIKPSRFSSTRVEPTCAILEGFRNRKRSWQWRAIRLHSLQPFCFHCR